MKKICSAALMLAVALSAPVTVQAQDWGRILQAGVKTVQSLTISDDQVQQYVHQYITSLDSKNKVAGPTDPYNVRLVKIVDGIKQVDGVPLNFKVYITKDVNAFACADGSVRVYSGLMDIMDDNEVLGVIGHEIGHVAHKDTKNAFKEALRTSALRDVIGSAGGTIGALSDSQLGAIGEALLSKGYSRKQETNADTYGYEFLKQHGKNPMYMATAFQKLNTVSGGSSNALMQAFSDHPDTNKRIKNIEKMAKKDGFTYPVREPEGSATASRTSPSEKSTSASSAKSSSSTKTSPNKSTTQKTTKKKSTSKKYK